MASHLIGAGSFEDGDFLRRKTRLDWRGGSTCMAMLGEIRSIIRIPLDSTAWTRVGLECRVPHWQESLN